MKFEKINPQWRIHKHITQLNQVLVKWKMEQYVKKREKQIREVCD